LWGATTVMSFVHILIIVVPILSMFAIAGGVLLFFLLRNKDQSEND
jgi:hypothetical protein